MKKLLVLSVVFAASAPVFANQEISQKIYTHPSQCLADSSPKVRQSSDDSNFFVANGACYDSRAFCFDGEFVVEKGGLDRNAKKTCLPSPHALTANLYWQ